MAKATWWKAVAVCASLACSGCTANPSPNSSATAGGNVKSAPRSSDASTEPSGSGSVSVRARRVTLTRKDPRGDVVSAPKDADWFEGATPVPRQVWGDIIGVRIRHTATEILVQARFATLNPGFQNSRNPMFRMGTTITTNTGITRDVELWNRNRSANIPDIQMLSNSESFACRLDHEIDTRRGLMTEHIPGSCVGNPQWVRVGINCLAFPDEVQMTLDVAFLDGYDVAREDIQSPPIYRR